MARRKPLRELLRPPSQRPPPRPLTETQRAQIAAHLARLQSLRPFSGWRLAIRKAGVTSAVLHGRVGSRAFGLRLHAFHGAAYARHRYRRERGRFLPES
jgi:hypothetical protein